MNYQKIYESIITKAENRSLEDYKEKHHIIPKCLGGVNDKKNIAILTAKEHFICHRLLVEIYPTNNKLRFALWAMTTLRGKYLKRRYKPSARVYERLKKEFSKRNSWRKGKTWEELYGVERAEQRKKAQSLKFKGYKHPPRTDEQRKRNSNSHKGNQAWNKGRKMLEVEKQKLKGRKRTEEQKERMRKSQREYRVKLEEQGIKKVFTEEQKQKCKDAQKRIKEERERLGIKRTVSEETRQKMRGRIPWNKKYF